MKTLFAAILLSALSFRGSAQTAIVTTGNAKVQSANVKGGSAVVNSSKMAPAYRCPVCGCTATKNGDCPKDKTNLVKVGDYYCPMCYMTSAKVGKCSMCDVDMKEMTATGKLK